MTTPSPKNTLTPTTISGRDTDLSQIGYAIERMLKEEFPINSVPVGLVERLYFLTNTLLRAEENIKEFILTVRAYKGHEDFMNE